MTTTIHAAENAYDLVPYPSHPFAQSHPSNLATIATLFGLTPAPVEACRVLELGCASGGNLIPMADYLPKSSFVGIDGSENQIQAGEKVIQAAQLPNIQLRAANILELGEELGQFDYIICHGVYSWVPPAVQSRIMEICKKCLAPSGVAYISYNTYPGWHMRGIIRDFMCYHAAKFSEPQVRVSQARALLDFLAKSLADQQTSFSLLLKEEVGLMQNQLDSYLFHEHLEAFNDPVYFHQFVERAREHGLQYLGESHLNSMFTGSFPPSVEQALRFLATDIVQSEQYMDFLRNRMFRQTLLVHDRAPIQRNVTSQRLEKLFVSAFPRQVESGEGSPPDEARFAFPSGLTISTQEPLVKVGLQHLADRWPEPVFVPALLKQAETQARVENSNGRGAAPAARGVLTDILLKGYLGGGVHLHANRMGAGRTIAERPCTTPLNRWQARHGGSIVGRRHQLAHLDSAQRAVLALLDGERTTAEIQARLIDDVLEDRLRISVDGAAIVDRDQVAALLEHFTNSTLAKLAELGLLAGEAA